MNYYLLIPFFIIIILFIPIHLKVKLSFNFLDFSGAFAIFLFNIKINSQQFWLKSKKILIKKDKDIESKEIAFDSKELIFLETFTNQIKDKTRLKELFIFYNLGLNDAFFTAMFSGYTNSFLYALLGVIKNQKPTASLGIFDTISYNKKVCQFAINSTLSISLFDVVYSLFNTVIISKKIHSQKRRKEKSL